MENITKPSPNEETPKISIKKVNTAEELGIAYTIRAEVFVKEQGVPMELELDEFEAESIHFLAIFHNIPTDENIAVGTARFRETENGLKLERFAVLSEYRSVGVGKHLLETVLGYISTCMPEEKQETIYLHAQEQAVAFYEKGGFTQEGDVFYEADIPHYKMIKR